MALESAANKCRNADPVFVSRRDTLVEFFGQQIKPVAPATATAPATAAPAVAATAAQPQPAPQPIAPKPAPATFPALAPAPPPVPQRTSAEIARISAVKVLVENCRLRSGSQATEYDCQGGHLIAGFHKSHRVVKEGLKGYGQCSKFNTYAQLLLSCGFDRIALISLYFKEKISCFFEEPSGTFPNLG